MSDRKQDAWENRLDEAQQWQVYDRLCRFPWYEVAPWIAEQFGIESPSRSAIYRFKNAMRSRESDHRIEQALRDTQSLDREIEQIGDISPRLRHAWLLKARESELRGDSQAGERYLRMAAEIAREQLERAKLAQRDRDLDLKLRRLEQLESKARAAGEILGESALTPAEKERRMKELFGL